MMVCHLLAPAIVPLLNRLLSSTSNDDSGNPHDEHPNQTQILHDDRIEAAQFTVLQANSPYSYRTNHYKGARDRDAISWTEPERV